MLIFNVLKHSRLSRLPLNYFFTQVKLFNKSSKDSINNLEMAVFDGTLDHHKGITVESKLNICKDITDFTSKLEGSLKHWNEEQYRGVWFNVNLSQVEWIPILAQVINATIFEKGFKVHHAKDETISLYLWLPKNESCKIPDYAHNMVGAGAVVLNDNNQILVVKERFRSITLWKLPGGYVNPGEEIGEAAQREVLEETGVQTEFVSMLSFRHLPKAVFGCSDLYFVVRLKPLSHDITKQDEEVDDCQWMDVNEFFSHEQVLEHVKNNVRQSIENEKYGLYMVREHTVHPLNNNPQFIYSLKKS